MAGQGEELQRRICRVCQESYDYPVARAWQPRFHCEACSELPAGVRVSLEKQARRIKELTVLVEQLRHEIESR